MKIITNHTRRPLLYSYELTPKELEDINNPQEHEQFFRYKGWVYQLSDFCRMESLQGWVGYSGETYFSGVVIKFSDDLQDVIVGRYIT